VAVNERGPVEGRGPASTMIEVSSLSHPDYLIELEAIAVL
jgi:enamine deaminase RidA (YjgF/YER057c/UK114 family)